MSKIALEGNASGTGTFTIASPNSNSNYTLTLPTSTGTVVVTGGAQTIEFAAGSAASPSITFTGDTNTGIFSPAADTIAFAEGGAEAMRINSSGNVGIGTTSPYGVTNYKVLTLDGTTGSGVMRRSNGTNALYTYSTATTSVVSEQRTLPLILETDGTERMRIDSSGNVLIGATSGLGRLHVYGSGQYSDLIMKTANVSTGLFSDNTNALGVVGTTSNHPMLFYTNNGERMRITSGGEVYIAGTTDQGAYNLQCNGTGVWGAGAYVNGSDARIKEDVAPIDSGLDVVTKLNPVTYRYKEDWSKDQSTQTGFIAQELLVALEGQSYVDGVVQQGGSEGYYSVAYQNIIPILTKAIQELNAKVDAQTTRIEALEAEVAALKGQ